MSEVTTVQATQDVVPAAASGIPVISEGPGAMLSAIIQMASNPQVDAEKLERLLHMQERMEARDAERQFNVALHLAQKAIPQIERNGVIDTGKGTIPFAKYEDMDKVLRPIMDRNGFSISFDNEPREGGGLVITATLHHIAGHHKTASIPLPIDTGPGRNNLQSMGSTLQYGRRYTTEMLFNIVRKGVDDDGKFGGTKFITDQQAMQIETLLKDTKADRREFMRWAGVGDEGQSLLDIEAKNFTVIINALNARKSKIGAAK